MASGHFDVSNGKKVGNVAVCHHKLMLRRFITENHLKSGVVFFKDGESDTNLKDIIVS